MSFSFYYLGLSKMLLREEESLRFFTPLANGADRSPRVSHIDQKQERARLIYRLEAIRLTMELC